MQIEYGPTAEALYLRLSHGEISETVEIELDIYVDVDRQGQPVGVEFVDAGAFLPFLQRYNGKLDIPADFAALAGARRLAS